jgi:hypothetical protein
LAREGIIGSRVQNIGVDSNTLFVIVASSSASSAVMERKISSARISRTNALHLHLHWGAGLLALKMLVSVSVKAAITLR